MLNSNLLYTYDKYDSVTKSIYQPIIDAFEHAVGIDVNHCINVNMTETYKGCIDFLLDGLKNATSKVVSPGMLIAYDDNILITVEASYGQPYNKINRECICFIYGKHEAVERYYRRLDLYSKNNKQGYIYWWYKSGDTITNSCFTVQSKGIKPEFYPWIQPDFAQQFDDSDSNILILLGPPGTGKTSFIRDLIKSDYSYTTYDEEIMRGDGIYISFLSDSNVKYLILEDADLILTDRLHDNNKVMSKMLNASDGLISFKNKKIIFSANIRDKSKIDEALVRPGRCFDIVNFRGLKPDEAKLAADAAGLPMPSRKAPDYTLAEIFNGNE